MSWATGFATSATVFWIACRVDAGTVTTGLSGSTGVATCAAVLGVLVEVDAGTITTIFASTAAASAGPTIGLVVADVLTLAVAASLTHTAGGATFSTMLAAVFGINAIFAAFRTTALELCGATTAATCLGHALCTEHTLALLAALFACTGGVAGSTVLGFVVGVDTLAVAE